VSIGWRKKNAHLIIRESSRFLLFTECIADARNYSFNFAADKFHVVEE
jgi:hypothetical protein